MEGLGPQLILVFASVEYFADSPLATRLRACCPNALRVGGSTAGVIAPFSTSRECKLHNQTMTITFLGEA